MKEICESDLLKRITVSPDSLGGKPAIRDIRIFVALVLMGGPVSLFRARCRA